MELGILRTVVEAIGSVICSDLMRVMPMTSAEDWEIEGGSKREGSITETAESTLGMFWD